MKWPEAPLTALAWRGASALRRARGKIDGVDVRSEAIELHSTAGYRLAGRVFRPVGNKALPALVVSPAIHQGIAALSGTAAVVDARELARLGFVVLVHDPAGRGESWGEEDFGGPEHQDDLRAAIRAAAELPGTTGLVGVLSLSLGLAAAAAALARWPELPVAWLVDWEGPCDREIITASGTRMVPAAGHTLDDEAWWAPREAVRHVGRLRCGYVRLQAFPDHAQPEEVRHARRMVRAALAGSAAFCQLNDHPRGQLPERPEWLRGGPLAANRAILGKLATLAQARPEASPG
jgi:predicted acyl esterase